MIIAADIHAVDECDGVVCLNGGRCQDGWNSFSCVCEHGFAGTHCEMCKYMYIYMYIY